MSRDEPGEVDARPAGTILDRATVETAVMGDGRYVIYYSWPDDV